jgi:hypothetical protein
MTDLPQIPPLPPPFGRPRPLLTAQVVFGVVVIIVGFLFTLDNLEVLHAEDYLRFWPVALVAFGGVKLWSAVHDGQGWFGGLFFLSIGTVLLAERVADVNIGVRDLWPMFLVLLGGHLVWRGFGVTRRTSTADSRSDITGLAIMGGVERRSTSPAFGGGELTAILGACEVDLRKASITPGTEAVIDVFAFWGGIDLKVPDDWTIINRVAALMGAVEDKSESMDPSGSKRLVLRGVVLMGGVSLKN